MELPTDDLNDILHDEEDDNSINILKDQSCHYFEPEEVHQKLDAKSFSLYSHNIRSLSGHFNDLKDSLYSMLPATFSVIALQEVWSISKCYDLTGYSQIIYKTRDMNSDPNPNCGGGVGFFVNNNFDFEVLEEESIFKEGVYESLWIKVKTDKNNSKIIGNVYRPNTAPKASINQAIEIHSSILSKISKNKNHTKCAIEVVGDFNIDLLQFQTHEQTNDYMESSFSFGLLPVITKPTRVTPTSATLIDHIWVHNKSKIHTAGIILSHISDHFPTFYVDQTHVAKQKPQPYKTRLINEATQNSLKDLLQTANFESVLSESEPQKAFDNFFSLYNSSAELAFPEITIHPKKSKFAHSPWMTPGLLISSKSRHKLLRTKQTNPSRQNISNFRQFNKIFTACRRKAQALYYSEKFTQCKSDLKETWRLVREVSCSKARQRDKIPDFFRYKNNILREPQEIADNFNKYFTEIGPDLANKIPASEKTFSEFLGAKSDLDFKFCELSDTRLLNFIKRMKPKTSFGEDLISNKVLQFVAPYILQPLKHLINMSLKTGYFPDKFKVAKIIPIFKDTDKHEFNNYRPISLLSSLSRLFESIVCFQLTGFADACDIFSKHQFGFRAKHNVQHPILHFSDNIFQALNEGKINLTVFIDLKKAFDTVDYEILLSKLEHYGVRGTELLWFRNYLKNRTQYVNLSLRGETVNSCLLECKCGVPQGSCLGPLLFLFFINDLPQATDFFSILFADDTTFQLSGANTSDIFARANIELGKAEQWFSANKLTLNAKKTRFMVFKSRDQHVHVRDLYLQNNLIQRAGNNCKEKYVRFLGVWIDEEMSFSGHIAKLKGKLNSAIYALATCNTIVPLKVRKLIYRSLFESHLHFGSLLYGATQPKNLEQIEVVQRKALRLVARAKYNAHTDPLFKRHEMLKLSDLIKLNQTLFVRQYKNGKLPPSFHNFFQDIPFDEQKSRDDDYNLKLNQLADRSLLYFPGNQMIRAWNSNNLLIKSEADCTTLKENFKQNKLDLYEDDCLKPNCYVCNLDY